MAGQPPVPERGFPFPPDCAKPIQRATCIFFSNVVFYDDSGHDRTYAASLAEEINGTAFTDLHDARRRINSFIAEIYNKERPHSALGYQSPLEFETAFAQNKAR